MNIVFKQIEKDETAAGEYFSVDVDAPNEPTLTHGNLYSGDKKTLLKMMSYLKYGEELRDGLAAAIDALGSNPTMSELEVLTDKLNRLYKNSKP